MRKIKEVRVKRGFKSYRFDIIRRASNLSSTFYVETDSPLQPNVTVFKKGQRVHVTITDHWCKDPKGQWDMHEEELYFLERQGFIETFHIA